MRYRWWIVISAALFLLAVLIGLYTPGDFPLPNDIKNSLRDISSSLKPYYLTTTILIFIRNTVSLTLSFLFSPFLCLSPLVTLLINGWILGFVSMAALEKVSVIYLLAGILPHGVFELPAIIIGEASAFSFGSAIILAIFIKSRRTDLKFEIMRSVRYLILAIILLIPAALIETYITPALIGR
jgi:stage II sporulation protein M